MPKIIDTFIFYNELDMLEFRLTELDPVVDHFVLVESTMTFTGKDKPLYFSENKERFKDFLDKITVVVVSDTPRSGAWGREYHQRNCIARGVKELKPADDDIVIISDADEIPDTNVLAKIKKDGLKGAYRFKQDFYYYNLTCKGVGITRCRAMDHKTFLTQKPNKHSKTSYPYFRGKGGWHFSYFGSPDFIANKIQNFSHQEFNKPQFTNANAINARIKDCADLFDRPRGGPHKFKYLPIEENDYLPKNYKMLLKLTEGQATRD